MSIRSKALLLSLTLLSIPYVGYESVREMESWLRYNLETSLLDSAHTVSSILGERSELFSHNLLDVLQSNILQSTQILKNPIQLDGSASDWAEQLSQARWYGEKHILMNRGEYKPDSLSFQHATGIWRTYLYVLFKVRDDKLVYRDVNSVRLGLNLDRSDHAQLAMQTSAGQIERYIITPTAPGWVSAYRLAVDPNSTSLAEPETRIQGMWATTPNGYLLEFRIPLDMIGDKLGFAIADVDDTEQRSIQTVIGTSITYDTDTVGNIFIPSPIIGRLIRSLGHSSGRRIRVLDRYRRVLAQHGDLRRELPDMMLDRMYNLIIGFPQEDFLDDQAHASHLSGEEINSALGGHPKVRWRPTSDQRAVIVSAAYPVITEGQIMGVVIVEETSNSIQMVQRQAIINLINKTLLVFSVVTLILLAFATRLSVRLRRLRNEAEQAIDDSGRVTETWIGSTSTDEIGDLSRSFSSILNKLHQYNTYLEGMASKLSHELRTPLVIVRSSLENLEQEIQPDSESMVYIERAQQGISRLNTIITHLSEATRLEQAMQNAEHEQFDLTNLVKSCISGYRLIYPQCCFQSQLLNYPLIMEGVPDLIAQMLDKLISNAVDFALPGTPIQISLSAERQQAQISIINQGKPLPTDQPMRLFDSMVCLRTRQNSDEPHLGLGLYVVKLIANHHGGQAYAANYQPGGAIFTVSLPLKMLEMMTV